MDTEASDGADYLPEVQESVLEQSAQCFQGSTFVMQTDLRLELRTKNNILWHAIMDLYPSVAEFCRIHNLDDGRVGALLTLKLSPYGKNGPLKLARDLCEITGLDLEALFPSKLYTDIIPRRMIAEVSSERFVSLQSARQVALPPALDESIEAGELSEALAEVLKTLTPREELVIRERFGLGDEGEQGLSEVGQHLRVSRERVRQIEAKAMRKLRHPSRNKKLQPFIEPRYSINAVAEDNLETPQEPPDTRSDTPLQFGYDAPLAKHAEPLVVLVDTNPADIEPHAFIGQSPTIENGVIRYGWWNRIVLRTRNDFIGFDPEDLKYAPAESKNSRITHILVPTTPHGVNGIYLELQGTAEPIHLIRSVSVSRTSADRD